MKELNDEIKLTLNLMQADINDGAHGELQCHLACLLEIKRNEIQQRLAECSWFETVTHDQAPYKSVKLDGQVADEAKPLTADELKAGGWWCADVSEECLLALIDNSDDVVTHHWYDNVVAQCAYKSDSESNVLRAHLPVDLDILKQIHRISNEFYWSEK